MLKDRGADWRKVHDWGSVALLLFTAAHSLYSRFINIFGACISETTMRPNPKVNDWGCNAVHWAALQGNLPMCRWLQVHLPRRSTLVRAR